MKMPTIFVSHGSPLIVVEEDAIKAFLQSYGSRLKPKACLVISAHWETADLMVSGAEHPDLIYDFSGFSEALYQVKYPVAGDLELAHKVSELVGAKMDDSRGLDHGAWVVMKMLFPGADIPVVQLSISSGHDAEWHYKLGKKLKQLREEGYLVVASGGLVHNLRTLQWDDKKAPVSSWSKKFLNAFEAMLFEQGALSVLNPNSFPDGERAVPTMDHYTPFFVAAGAGGELKAKKIYDDWHYGTLSMQIYEWE